MQSGSKKPYAYRTRDTGAYLASFDEKSRAAVQYGNFAEQAERDMAKTSDSYGALDAFTDARYSAVLAEAERLMAADARLKAVVEYLQAEYKKKGALESTTSPLITP